MLFFHCTVWGRSAPFLEVLQYQVDAWSGRSKPLFHLPVPKINLIYGPRVGDVSDIKLIRTDTTLDLSQKAEKRCLTKILSVDALLVHVPLCGGFQKVTAKTSGHSSERVQSLSASCLTSGQILTVKRLATGNLANGDTYITHVRTYSLYSGGRGAFPEVPQHQVRAWSDPEHCSYFLSLLRLPVEKQYSIS